MNQILLGKTRPGGRDFHLPVSSFSTHYHLLGGTGKGKTTLIHTFLQPLLSDPFDPACFVIIDRMGGFSQDLLLWMASDEFCPEHVRERLVYFRAAREDMTLPFNPLLHDTPDHAYYKVGRATELILRAWESSNIEAMPRLARWTANAFSAAASLGLTISDCVHFVMPGSVHHARLLELLPDGLRSEWAELARAPGQAQQTLDSTRNRLKPFVDSGILRRLFGSAENRFDVRKFIRAGKIVLVDLSPGERLPYQLGNTVGGLILNEVLATVRSMPRGERRPTYLILDEFQNFVGPDIALALPEVRQLGIRLVLSHQSLAQLERGDHDLSALIFQAQSRIVFGLQGEDADLLAHEVASLTFDPMKIKEILYNRRQWLEGYRKDILRGGGTGSGSGETWSDGRSRGTTAGQGKAKTDDRETTSENAGTSDQHSRTQGGSNTTSQQESWHEQLVPIHREYEEIASKTYSTFEEQKQEWARRIRGLRTGQALAHIADDPRIHQIDVRRSAPGHLAFDHATLERECPQELEAVERLIERSMAANGFVTSRAIELETERRFQKLLSLPGEIRDRSMENPDDQPPADEPEPFT